MRPPIFLACFTQGVGSEDECLCNTGYEGYATQGCESCPAGKYKENPGSSDCLPCQIGTFSSETGLTTPQDCDDCEAGKYDIDPEDGSMCTDCSPGTFSGMTGATTMVCSTCPDGSSSPSGTLENAGHYWAHRRVSVITLTMHKVPPPLSMGCVKIWTQDPVLTK